MVGTDEQHHGAVRTAQLRETSKIQVESPSDRIPPNTWSHFSAWSSWLCMAFLSFSLRLLASSLRAVPPIPQETLAQASHPFWLRRTPWRCFLATEEFAVPSSLYVPTTPLATAGVVSYLTITLVQQSVPGLWFWLQGTAETKDKPCYGH